MERQTRGNCLNPQIPGDSLLLSYCCGLKSRIGCVCRLLDPFHQSRVPFLGENYDHADCRFSGLVSAVVSSSRSGRGLGLYLYGSGFTIESGSGFSRSET